MALEVEDGTGKANAEAYASVADADAYHTARGNTTWTGDSTAKEAALRKATDYLEQVYSERWRGDRTTSTQALSWPRVNAYRYDWPIEGNALPPELIKASAELALRALGEDLLPDQDAPVASEAVGPIVTTYFQGARQIKRWTVIERLAAPLLRGGGGAQLVRA